MALSQWSRSNSPVVYLCCWNEVVQFMARVFQGAKTEILNLQGVNIDKEGSECKAKKNKTLNINIDINMNHGRWHSSLSYIIDWEAPVDSNGRMLKGKYISIFSWTSLAAAIIWVHKNHSPLTIFTSEKP